jgi:putative phosphoesterase
MILHAGDVVDPAILDDLSQIAPVRAVRGNCDYHEPAYRIHILRDTLQIQLGGYRIFVVHRLPEADPSRMQPEHFTRWKSWNPRVAIFGHTHCPEKIEKNGTLFFNRARPAVRAGARPRLAFCISGPRGSLPSISWWARNGMFFPLGVAFTRLSR